MTTEKSVMVSGCFDLLHPGHIFFFETAASYGRLHVSVGSDQTYEQLKGRKPILTEAERLYMVQACKYVYAASIAGGHGTLDFLPTLLTVKPDLFIVNQDGHTTDKQEAVEELGVRYLVLPRQPRNGFNAYSSTDLKKEFGDTRVCLD